MTPPHAPRWPASVRRLWLAALSAIVASGLLATSAPAPVRAALPSGFVDEVVISGLTNPTQLDFAQDGRIFIAEKSGLIKVFDGFADTSPTVFADLRTQVHNFWDRGLLGMALHPDFPDTPWVYALYTHDAEIGETAPRWGSPGQTGDPCPTPPGATDDGCVVSGRLSRLTAVGNVSDGSEAVLIEDWCQQYPSHSIGDLVFGPDGALYVSGGDGASFTFTDYGQDGNPLNPCDDPPTGVGTLLSPPTAEGGALRSQDLRTSGDPVTLDGAILRVDPATGAAMPGNPLISNSDDNAKRIVAYGLRNPFRITTRPGTNEIWVGDVGRGTWEEVNRVANPTGGVLNFGWPCYEGAERLGAFDNTNLDICENLYASGTATGPYFTYRHDLDIAPPDDCPPAEPPAQVSSSIAGLAFNPGTAYPAAYDGALFGADYSRNCIWVMFAGSSGLPDPATIVGFQDAASQPVSLKFGPDGSLYYVDIGGRIHRIRYTGQNQPPSAVVSADPTSGTAPLEVQFDGSASTDPEGAALTYAWDLDADGQFDDSTQVAPTHTYTDGGTYQVQLRVTDPGGESDTAPVTIQVSNTVPEVFIDTPAAGTTWKVGDEITFTGHATDAEDGDLSATMDWELLLHHCATTCHIHPITSWTDVTGGAFTAPDHEYPSHLELIASVTDTAGTTVSASRELDPQTVQLSFATDPSGLTVNVGGDSATATPFSRTVILGSTTPISTDSPQSGSGSTWVFESWSDGGAQAHDVVAPPGGATFTATFSQVTTSCPSDLPSIIDGSWQRNGTAVVSGSSVELTSATTHVVGSVVHPTEVAREGLHVCFDAEIGGGTGADGMTLMLLDPSAGAGALGADGSGLGYGGLNGVAVALDTYQSPGDPSGNFVGVANGGSADGLTYLATNTAIPILEDTGPHSVDVSVAGGRIVVALDGSQVLDVAVSLPDQVLVGFSAATGGATNQHLVSNVAVDVGSGEPAPPNLTISPTSLDYGSVEVGSSKDLSVELSNTGDSDLTLSSVSLPSAPFSAVAPTIGAGTVIPAGGSVTQVLRFAPSSEGSFNSSLVVSPDTGQGPITVSLTGSGVEVPATSCPSDLPSIIDSAWQRNGSATVSGAAVELTPVTSKVAGSAVYSTAVAREGLHVCFDAEIGGGTGADGMTLMLLDPSAGAGALGSNGGGLGFSGLNGVAVTLDTYRNPGDPTHNFVGIATGSDGLTYLATNTAIPILEDTGPHSVEVTVAGGRIVVLLDGSQVLDVAVSLPDQVLVGFSAATGGRNNRHLVSNVAVDVL